MANLTREAAGRCDAPCCPPTRKADSWSTLPSLTVENPVSGGKFPVSRESKGCVDWVPTTILESSDLEEPLSAMYQENWDWLII